MDGLDDLDTRLLVDLLRDHSDPRKSLGQHYLVDDQVIERTMDIPGEFSKQLSRGSHVLEVGPGPGSLTLALLRFATRSLVRNWFLRPYCMRNVRCHRRAVHRRWREADAADRCAQSDGGR